MPKSKPDQSQGNRKRANRDTIPYDREKSWRPTDENFAESDGTVDEEIELDTNKYDAPRSR